MVWAERYMPLASAFSVPRKVIMSPIWNGAWRVGSVGQPGPGQARPAGAGALGRSITKVEQ